MGDRRHITGLFGQPEENIGAEAEEVPRLLHRETERASAFQHGRTSPLAFTGLPLASVVAFICEVIPFLCRVPNVLQARTKSRALKATSKPTRNRCLQRRSPDSEWPPQSPGPRSGGRSGNGLLSQLSEQRDLGTRLDLATASIENLKSSVPGFSEFCS